jgi:inositol 2-dehydrogenase
MEKRLNVGLIGVGRFGTMCSGFIAHRVPRARLVAVADLVEERAKSAAERLDVPHWYSHHLDLLADPQVEAVVVTATTLNHKEIVLDAAAAGKIIFCEKPLTLTLADAYEMKEAIAKRGVYYQQGFQRRFDKGFAAAKKKIEEGVIGKPVIFRGSSRDPYPPVMDYLNPKNSGGQILDMAIHDIDVARWYMGEVETVYAIGGAWVYEEAREVQDTDNALIALMFSDGGVGEIDISRNGIYGYDIRAEVQGSKGAIQAGYLRDTPILVMNEEGVKYDTVPYFPERFAEAYVAQLNNYVHNVLEGLPPKLTVDDGIAALRIAIAATASLHRGQPVAISEFSQA